jgi:RimJ/RimL family protein N-acetyltransferase
LKQVESPCLEAFEIDTERLHLRPLQPCDEALFHALYTNPDTMRFIAPPLSTGQAARYFRSTVVGMQATPIRWLSLAMLRKPSQQPVGICGVANFDAAARRLEVGILLTAEARSQGVAREGLTALMDRLFDVLPVDELWARFSADHPAAERLVASAGFAPCIEVEVGKGPVPRRIWSVQRSTWFNQ